MRPERVELPTFWFVARRSIQLSYGRTELGFDAAYSMFPCFFNSGVDASHIAFYGNGTKDCVAPSYFRRRLVQNTALSMTVNNSAVDSTDFSAGTFGSSSPINW